MQCISEIRNYRSSGRSKLQTACDTTLKLLLLTLVLINVDSEALDAKASIQLELVPPNTFEIKGYICCAFSTLQGVQRGQTVQQHVFMMAMTYFKIN